MAVSREKICDAFKVGKQFLMHNVHDGYTH